MSSSALHHRTFKRGGHKCFNSCLFFPRSTRRDLEVLYAFVRIADSFVETVPQHSDAFSRFRAQYEQARLGKPSESEVINSFCELERRRGFRSDWTDAFLHSMELDLHKFTYCTVEETLEYVHGSGEVIGLYIAAVLNLPPEAHDAARMLGRATQYITFVRDIDKYNRFGRCYLPIEETTLADLEYATVVEDAPEFMRFMNAQLERYHRWRLEGETGYQFLSRRKLIPIKTAAETRRWTAAQIERNPFIVYERQVKPSRLRVLAGTIRNATARTARLYNDRRRS